MEVVSDEFSHFRFTRLMLKIPIFNVKPIDSSTILKEYKETFFNALNIFIDSVRFSLKRYGLKNYYEYTQFVDPIAASSSKKLTPKGKGMTISVEQSFGIGGLTRVRPNRTKEEHSSIQKLIYENVSLAVRVMCDARRDIYYNNYLHALLNSVIALEISVSDTIRRMVIHKNISDSDVNNLIQTVGLTGNIKTTLKLLTPEGKQLPSEDIFTNCKSAITMRNAIMHKGRRNVVEKEVLEYLDSIEEMISFCRTL